MIKPLEYAESILRSNPMNAYDIATSDEYRLPDNMVVYLDALYIEIMALWLMSRFEETVDRADHLLELSQMQDSNLGLGRGHNVIGNVYHDMSNFAKALEHYVKGLSYSRAAEDTKIEAALLNNIGEIYKALEDYDEAVKYYKQSMVLSKSITERSTYGVSKLNIGEVLYEKGEIDEAYEYCHESINYFMEKEDYFSIAYGHFLLAKIYRKKEDRHHARNDLALAIDIMRRMQDHYNLNVAYLEMIEILLEEKRYEDALEYIEDAMDIAQRLNLNKDKAAIALQSAEIYEAMHLFDKALDAYKLYVVARFDHEKEKEEEHVKNLKAQMNIESTMHEKEIYRQKNIELKIKGQEIEKLYDDMKTITNIGQNITSTLEIKEVMHLLFENLTKLMDAQTFGIYLYKKDEEVITRNLLYFKGRAHQREPISIHSKVSLSAWVISHKEALLINDCKALPQEIIHHRQEMGTFDKKPSSTMVVPLVMQEDVIGCIVVKSSVGNAYTDYNFNLIKALASYITIAVINSQESQMLSEEINMRIEVQKSLEALNKKLSEMSYRDALTRIANRRSFVEFLSRELIRGARRKEHLVILLIDIDHFKEYNDNYGHVKGDTCLTTVAQSLRKTLKRKMDFVARYGGDEFVVVLSDIEKESALAIANSIKKNVNEEAVEHRYSPVSDIVTLTIGGVYFVPTEDTVMEGVISKADAALYKAKDKGRNQICFYD